MANSDSLNPEILPLYIQYERLTVCSLAQLYLGFAAIAEHSIHFYAKATGVKPDCLPTLELITAKTGDSIKFTFGEGLLPTISSDEQHDIIVNVPKKLGIPLLVGFLVLNGVKLVLDVRNAYLDTQIKEIELQLKKTELGKTLSPQTTGALSEKATTVVHEIIDNRNFNSFFVYDIDILEMRDKRERKQGVDREKE